MSDHFDPDTASDDELEAAEHFHDPTDTEAVPLTVGFDHAHVIGRIPVEVAEAINRLGAVATVGTMPDGKVAEVSLVFLPPSVKAPDDDKYANDPAPGVTRVHTHCLHELEAKAESGNPFTEARKERSATEIGSEEAVLGALMHTIESSSLPIVRMIRIGHSVADDPHVVIALDFMDAEYELRVTRAE